MRRRAADLLHGQSLATAAPRESDLSCSSTSPRGSDFPSTNSNRSSQALLAACAGQLDGDVRRSADDPRAAIGIGRATLGQAPDRFQKQHILFGEHGISSSELASPLVWRDAANIMLPEFDFRTFSWNQKNGFVGRMESFVAAACNEAEITESLIAAARRAAAHAPR